MSPVNKFLLLTPWQPLAVCLQAKLEFLESVRTLERLGFNLFASYGTADYYSEHGVKVQPIEWPYSDGNGSKASPPLRRGNASGNSVAASLSIGDYLAQKRVDLVINLPLRQNRSPSSAHRVKINQERVDLHTCIRLSLLLGTPLSLQRVILLGAWQSSMPSPW